MRRTLFRIRRTIAAILWLGAGAAATTLLGYRALAQKPVPKAPLAPPYIESKRDPAPIAAAIDREVDARLTEARVPASPRADDAEFLRRVTLDITGRIPTLSRTIAFLDSQDPAKRRKLIDELLASQQYGQHLATLWRNLMVPRNPANGKAQPDRFSPWLAEQFNRNRGWDALVTELLTVEGDIQKTPQTAFIIANSESFQPQPNLLAASVGRLFLGVQLQCAECHNHPFTAWKQDDFWATAAFFSRLRNSGLKKPPFALTEMPAPDTATGDQKGTPQPVVPPGSIAIPTATGKNGGKVVKARFLDGAEPGLNSEAPFRPVFAAWVTAPENKYFANALVNRMWAQFFGRGFVNPVDNFHDDNPASHPALLRLLADEFRASGHDLKHLIRCICNSQAYQRSSRPLSGNENDKELFSHMVVKVLGPESIYDSLAIVLSIDPSARPAAPKGAAVKSKGPPLSPREEFIHFFRTRAEAAEAGEFSHGIPQFLKRMNAEEFNNTAPLISRLARPGTSREQVLEQIYLAVLSRRPSPAEVQLLSKYLAKRDNAEQGYNGVLWILINSGEFVLNH